MRKAAILIFIIPIILLLSGCGQADVKIVGGNDIILKSVVCSAPDDEEGVGPPDEDQRG